jgi:hypothetical protein
MDFKMPAIAQTSENASLKVPATGMMILDAAYRHVSRVHAHHRKRAV